MDTIRFPEFLPSLENTKYPFIHTAALSNNIVSFLEGTFLDAHLYATTSIGRYYLSKVVVKSDRFTIYVGDSAMPELLSTTLAIPLTTGVIQLKDIYGRPGGVLVSEPDRLAIIPMWGVGTHTFERNQTEFCVTCQVPIPDPGVTGLRLESGEILSGTVWLIGEDGVVIRNEMEYDQNGNLKYKLRIDVVGDPLYRQSLCTDNDLYVPINPIRNIRVINGDTSYDCSPDANGNFNIQMNNALTEDAALRIETIPEGIVFAVKGSTPSID